MINNYQLLSLQLIHKWLFQSVQISWLLTKILEGLGVGHVLDMVHNCYQTFCLNGCQRVRQLASAPHLYLGIITQPQWTKQKELKPTRTPALTKMACTGFPPSCWEWSDQYQDWTNKKDKKHFQLLKITFPCPRIPQIKPCYRSCHYF